MLNLMLAVKSIDQGYLIRSQHTSLTRDLVHRYLSSWHGNPLRETAIPTVCVDVSPKGGSDQAIYRFGKSV